MLKQQLPPMTSGWIDRLSLYIITKLHEAKKKSSDDLIYKPIPAEKSDTQNNWAQGSQGNQRKLLDPLVQRAWSFLICHAWCHQLIFWPRTYACKNKGCSHFYLICNVMIHCTASSSFLFCFLGVFIWCSQSKVDLDLPSRHKCSGPHVGWGKVMWSTHKMSLQAHHVHSFVIYGTESSKIFKFYSQLPHHTNASVDHHK